MRDAVQKVENEARPILLAILQQHFDDLGVKYEQATWDIERIREGKSSKRVLQQPDVAELDPFHWGFEFDRVLNQKGGFDAIITNPPWEVMQQDQKEFLIQRYGVEIEKNKIPHAEWSCKSGTNTHRSRKYLRDYLSYVSELNLQKSYLRLAPEYDAQKAIIAGRNESGKLNFFNLFAERCYRLLRVGGLCGIVVPSGIHTDLGSTGSPKDAVPKPLKLRGYSDSRIAGPSSKTWIVGSSLFLSRTGRGTTQFDFQRHL